MLAGNAFLERSVPRRCRPRTLLDGLVARHVAPAATGPGARRPGARVAADRLDHARTTWPSAVGTRASLRASPGRVVGARRRREWRRHALARRTRRRTSRCCGDE